MRQPPARPAPQPNRIYWDLKTIDPSECQRDNVLATGLRIVQIDVRVGAAGLAPGHGARIEGGFAEARRTWPPPLGNRAQSLPCAS